MSEGRTGHHLPSGAAQEGTGAGGGAQPMDQATPCKPAMSPDKQRITIAEVCGWRFWSSGDPFLEHQRFADTNFGGYVRRVERVYADRGVTLDMDESPIFSPNRFGEGREFEPINGWLSPRGRWKLNLPDYLNDLNAMHEAEKVLTDADEKWQCRQYANALEAKLTRDNHHQRGPSRFGFIHATARQRAEAFLRTIGKWEE